MRKILFLLIACLMTGNISVTYILGAPAGGDYDGSDWAKREITQAIEKGIVPDELQYNYKNNITRGEFCKLCVYVMKAWNSDINPTSNKISFSDSNNEEVMICADKGIVSGIGNNKFAPNNPIKRQEAAKMLYNTLFSATSVIHKKYITDECCIPHSFDDGTLIQSWARDEINHMYRFGVMLGDSDNNYNPNGYYTREQAICTFLRLYNCKDNISENNIPKSDYYVFGECANNYISDGVFDNYNKHYYAMRYIDSKGNRYTEDDEGQTYPFNLPYTAFILYDNWEYANNKFYRIYDKNGNSSFDDVFEEDDPLSGLFDEVKITPYSIFFTRRSDGLSMLYKLPEKKKLFENVRPVGEDLYFQYDDEYKFINLVNLDGEILIDSSKGYTNENNLFFNGICVLKNEKGFYSIINSKGEILKNFTVDPSWQFLDSIGSNMVFSRNVKKGELSGFINIFYRAFSEKSFVYDYVNLTENNEAIAVNDYEKDSEKNYILNPDGSVKFECGKCESLEKVDGFNLYMLRQVKDKSMRYDIIDENGNIIKTFWDARPDIETGNAVHFDKSGVCAYISQDNVINFFDFFGNDLCKFDSKKYGNISTSVRFINGLLWVDPYNEDDNFDGFYVTPYGKILR